MLAEYRRNTIHAVFLKSISASASSRISVFIKQNKCIHVLCEINERHRTCMYCGQSELCAERYVQIPHNSLYT